MTERLAQLLHDEATALDTPAPPAREILERGRRTRARRRTGVVAAGAGLVAAVTAVAVTVGGGLGTTETAPDPAGIAQFEEWGAVATGRDVYVGDAHVRWDADVSAMYYTSQGVVVRSGGEYALVRADGEVVRLSVVAPDRIPGFEPDSTRFAYVDPLGDNRWEVVVHDAATDQELARTEITGPAYGGWDAPPAAIDGDLVWVHLGDGWVEVDWRTDAVRQVPGTEDTYELANGAYAVQAGRYTSSGRSRGAWQVRAWSDGSLLGTADLPRGWYAFFSPDGRFLSAFPNEVDPKDWDPLVYEVATGGSRAITDDGEDFGWTPSGRLLIVDGNQLRVCAPISGECTSRPFDRGSAPLRIGGNPYES